MKTLGGRAGGIGVNASIVGDGPTGLGLYTINVTRALDALRNDLVIYTSSPPAFAGLRAKIVPISSSVRPERGMRGHFMRLAWVQTELRLRTRRGTRALLNTIPEAILGASIPQVTVVHDLLPLFFPAEYPRQQYYFRSLVPRVLRSSRVVVADSESTRQDIIQSYGIAPEKVRVIYPGYDPATYAVGSSDGPSDSTQPSYLLYVGNLLPHKNLLNLLDALAILRRRRPARLIIRGEGQFMYKQAVRERVETLGLRDAVTFQQYADGAALRDLYARAACLVLPSLHEGFGLPVLEAMACGTPVITSTTSSLPEVGGDVALRADPYDTIELSDAMCRVLEDRDLREDLRERGLKWVRGFSWHRTAEQMSRLLDEVARA
ncbi:MAG TPA: glycosyltransferase family 1 protein [Candidatus Methylomirabilis sp.]|nr:glycosyltransferase family 1 protein [Candidatus Methylomirabilis sp.]